MQEKIFHLYVELAGGSVSSLQYSNVLLLICKLRLYKQKHKH